MTQTALARLSAAWKVELIQAGRLSMHEYRGKPWQTAIYKTPLTDRVQVDRYGIVGDEHTGSGPDLDRAICLHPLVHYGFWQAYFRREIPVGFFGENIVLAGLTEEDLCVGDVIRVGTALLQVTQPRIPCYKQANKLEVPDFVKLLIQTGKVGFLVRVLEPGIIGQGDNFTLLERPHPTANLVFVNRVLYEERLVDAACELAELVPLAHDWKAKFVARSANLTA